MIRYARVKNFDPQGFGFLSTGQGPDVFFHLSTRRELIETPEGPDRCKFGNPLTGARRIPKRGDNIAYDEKRAAKGLRADSWGFAEEVIKATQMPAVQPPPAIRKGAL